MRIIPITPLFLLIFAMFIFGWSITQYGGISQYGAGFMPCIISGLLLFLAAIDVAIDIKHRHRNKVSLTFDEVKALLLVITVVLLFVLLGNDSNLLIVFYVQIMPDDFVMQLHRF